MTEIHITDPTPIDEEVIIEKSLRPSKFDDFVGQTKLLESFPSFFGGNPFGSKGWQGKKPKKFEEID